MRQFRDQSGKYKMSDTPKFQPNDAAAGGWGALHATAKALREQSALLKGGKSLLSMNQPDGFDCPGCAWPDPKHTSSFEFCENGAKAVAWETTGKRGTRDFFAKGTVVLEDFEHADAIFILGQNPGTNSPRMMTELHNASRRGAPIVVFNPLKERALERFTAPQDPIEMATLRSVRIASEYCQVKVGGDVAALKGIMKLVLEVEDDARAAGRPSVLDWVFIAEHTDGFEAFAADLRQTPWEGILSTSGLSRAQLERVAQVCMQSKAVIACYGIGITQHQLGPRLLPQGADLPFLAGYIGRSAPGS